MDLALVVSALAGCGEGGSTLSASSDAVPGQSVGALLGEARLSDLNEIEQLGSLRVLEYRPQGEPSGSSNKPRYDDDLLQAFARRLKVELLRVPVSDPNSMSTLLLEGRADLIVGYVSQTESLAGQLHVASAKDWVVRRSSPALAKAVDAFLSERAMTGHTREISKGDLDAIRQRGVLRVLTANSPITYFLYRGSQYGFDYELAKMLALELGVRLEMVVPPTQSDLIAWLEEGRADIIAASFTATDARRKRVAFSLPYLYVDEVLVQRRGAPRLASVQALAGKRVFVRPSSSYAMTLEQLRPGVAVEVEAVDKRLSTEDLVEMVGRGEIPYTVVDSHILEMEQTYRNDVEIALPLTAARVGSTDIRGKPRPGAKEIAFGVRPENPALLAAVNDFVGRVYRGLAYNIARNRYFRNKKRIWLAKERRFASSGRLSPYDALLKKYSERYGLDWRLMAAQAFVESRYDPRAKSWAGAVGIFQMLPSTGREVGFEDLKNPEVSIHAGIKYMAGLFARFDEEIPYRQRMRFAMASYNVGYGHVADARKLARELGLSPDRWFQNVERAMTLLMQPRYYRTARFGYCRGREPVAYVSRIQSLYDAYVKSVER